MRSSSDMRGPRGCAHRTSGGLSVTALLALAACSSAETPSASIGPTGRVGDHFAYLTEAGDPP